MEQTHAFFNRPSGTKTLSDSIPALKRRATLRASLWDANALLFPSFPSSSLGMPVSSKLQLRKPWMPDRFPYPNRARTRFPGFICHHAFEAGASQTSAFPSWSLGTRAKLECRFSLGRSGSAAPVNDTTIGAPQGQTCDRRLRGPQKEFLRLATEHLPEYRHPEERNRKQCRGLRRSRVIQFDVVQGE